MSAPLTPLESEAAFDAVMNSVDRVEFRRGLNDLRRGIRQERVELQNALGWSLLVISCFTLLVGLALAIKPKELP